MFPREEGQGEEEDAVTLRHHPMPIANAPIIAPCNNPSAASHSMARSRTSDLTASVTSADLDAATATTFNGRDEEDEEEPRY